jgi:hypothetical protein
MNTPREQEEEKVDREQYAVDRGALLLPPEPPVAGTIVILMPPTVTWRALHYRDVTKLEIDLEGGA